MLINKAADNSRTCLEKIFDSTNSNQTLSAFAIATTIPLSGIVVNLAYSLGCAEDHGAIRKVTELLT